MKEYIEREAAIALSKDIILPQAADAIEKLSKPNWII